MLETLTETDAREECNDTAEQPKALKRVWNRSVNTAA
jgi:hypothetical protein